MVQSPHHHQFEFFSSHVDTDKICIADDIIHDGKLLPFNLNHPFNYRRAKSESSNTSSNSTKHQKLRRATSEPAGPKRVPPHPPIKGPVRPRWYWFAFWSVRAPAEMEIRDIKKRLSRKRSSSTADVADINGRGNGAWRVIRSLSCNCREADSVVDATIKRPLRKLSISGPL